MEDIIELNYKLGVFLGFDYPQLARDNKFCPDCNWNDLMRVLEEIHEKHLKEDFGSRDLRYTIDYLLERGFLFNENQSLNLPFSMGNVYKRAIMFIDNLKDK